MRTSRQDQDRLIAEWKEGGLSLPAFARERGIPYSRMSYWVRRRRQETAERSEEEDLFTEVSLPPVQQLPSAGLVQVRVCGGERVVELGFCSTVGPGYVAQVVREVLR